jgi:hypothetical protein
MDAYLRSVEQITPLLSHYIDVNELFDMMEIVVTDYNNMPKDMYCDDEDRDKFFNRVYTELAESVKLFCRSEYMDDDLNMAIVMFNRSVVNSLVEIMRTTDHKSSIIDTAKQASNQIQLSYDDALNLMRRTAISMAA